MPATQLLDTVPEKSTLHITVNFKDENGVAVIPDTATWTLTDADGNVVNSREEVAISSPTAEEVVVLQGLDLAILNDELIEKRVFMIEATYDSGKPFKDTAEFGVENLVAIT